MPEGHTIHRLARDLATDLGGHRWRPRARQDRFADGARRLDGRVLERHVGLRQAPVPPLGHRPRSLHVHLGLFGKFRAAGRRRHPSRPTRSRLRLCRTETLPGTSPAPSSATLSDPDVVDEVASRRSARIRCAATPTPSEFVDRVRRSPKSIGALLLDQAVDRRHRQRLPGRDPLPHRHRPRRRGPGRSSEERGHAPLGRLTVRPAPPRREAQPHRDRAACTGRAASRRSTRRDAGRTSTSRSAAGRCGRPVEHSRHRRTATRSPAPPASHADRHDGRSAMLVDDLPTPALVVDRDGPRRQRRASMARGPAGPALRPARQGVQVHRAGPAAGRRRAHALLLRHAARWSAWPRRARRRPAAGQREPRPRASASDGRRSTPTSPSPSTPTRPSTPPQPRASERCSSTWTSGCPAAAATRDDAGRLADRARAAGLEVRGSWATRATSDHRGPCERAEQRSSARWTCCSRPTPRSAATSSPAAAPGATTSTTGSPSSRPGPTC